MKHAWVSNRIPAQSCRGTSRISIGIAGIQHSWKTTLPPLELEFALESKVVREVLRRNSHVPVIEYTDSLVLRPVEHHIVDADVAVQYSGYLPRPAVA